MAGSANVLIAASNFSDGLYEKAVLSLLVSAVNFSVGFWVFNAAMNDIHG